MAVFEYIAYDKSGRETRGTVEASDRGHAGALLSSMGVLTADLRERESGFFSGEPAGRVSRQEIASFFRQLTAFLESGFPLVSALTAAEEQTDNPRLKSVAGGIKKKVSEGQHMSDALGAYPALFPRLFVNMVRAGENSGALDNVLARIADLTEKQSAFIGRLRSMLAYPLIVGIIGIFITVFLLMVVLPSLTVIFSDMEQALPLPTVLLISGGDFFLSFWWVIGSAVLLAAAGVFLYGNSEKGRMHIDRIKLRLPVAGPLIWKNSTSRFCRTFGTLLESGVPVLSALETASSVLGNSVLSGGLEKVRQDVREGESITGPLRQEGIFPPLALRFMAAGEESGNLNDMLSRVADIYDEEVESRIGMLTSLLEPVIIIVMGVVVGFVVLAILLPIFEMSQVLR